MIALLLVQMAHAGYGDPIDGVPTPVEREVLLWTDLVRVDPAAFADAFGCWDSFTASEKEPKPPLQWEDGLGAAAHAHSVDMDTQGYFAHDSLDGTSWDARIYQYYDGLWIGENIAYGYWSAYDAVVVGWMCSAGHRVNIMSADYDEIGTGVSDIYFTQDFGFGGRPIPPIVAGAHLPTVPVDEVDLVAIFYRADAAAPDRFEVVLDGEAHPLSLALGAEAAGGWSVRLPVADGCQTYYFEAESAGETTRFPETGSYGWGACTFDDPDAAWIATQVEPDASDDEPSGSDPGGSDGEGEGDGDGDAPNDLDDPTTASDEGEPVESGGGCNTAPGAPLGGFLLLAIALVGGRRAGR